MEPREMVATNRIRLILFLRAENSTEGGAFCFSGAGKNKVMSGVRLVTNPE